MSGPSKIVWTVKALHREMRGVVALEFALLAPVMIIMFFGTFEVSRLIRAYLATNRAAQIFANLAAQEGSTGVTVSESKDFCDAAKLAMAPFPPSALSVSFASITKDQTSGTIAFDWTPQEDTTCGGGAGAFSDASTTANGLLTTNGDSLIVVKVKYVYTSPIHLVLPSSFSISQTAYQRPRTGNTIPHS